MSQTPKKEDNPAPAPTFKEQLDKEATGRDHEHDSDGHSIVQTVVDKISHVIPATMPIVGGSNPDAKVEKEAEAGPPHRPEHDAQIEEFVREQHRSNRAETLSDGRA